MMVSAVKKAHTPAYLKCSVVTLITILLLVGVFAYRGRYVERHTICIQCMISSAICIQLVCAACLSSNAIRYTAHRVTRIVACYLAAIPAGYAVIVLFGAPLVVDVTETFHLAALLSTLAVLPYVLYNKFDSNSVLRLWVLLEYGWDDTERLVFVTSTSTVLGAWLGAWPIPLDWDRPWQRWPITCTTGAAVGYCSGAIFNIIQHLYHAHKTNSGSSAAAGGGTKKKNTAQKHKSV